MKFEILILAAGKSSRMGSDKALLDINGQPSICHLISKLLPFAKSINIVLSINLQSVKQIVIKQFPHLKINFINNPDFELGMFSSIQKGLRLIPGNNPVLMHQIDQPFIPTEIYKSLVENYNCEFYTLQPSVKFQGRLRAGHPIIINNDFRKIILKYSAEHNLKAIILEYNNKRKFITVNNLGILHNLNTPEQFNKMKKEEKYGKSDK